MRRISNQTKLILIAISMVFSVISVSIAARAWFMFNRDNALNNLDIINQGDFDYTFSYKVNGVPASDNTILLEDIYPGAVHKNNVTFSIKNNDDAEKFYTSFFLAAPKTTEEVPFVALDGKYYYLGSQIQITKLDVALEGDTLSLVTALDSFLVTTSSSEVSKGQNTSVDAAIISIPDLFLVQGVEVPSGQTLTIDLDFTFVDNGLDQNVYRTDWPSVGQCKRTLKVHIWGDH